MPTVKQKKVAKVVVNGGTPTEGMREAKYAPSVIRKPAVVTETEGYKEALAEYGLTEELITSSLVEDIKGKPKRRLGELQMGAELLGMKKGGKEEGSNVQLNQIILKFNSILDDEESDT